MHIDVEFVGMVAALSTIHHHDIERLTLKATAPGLLRIDHGARLHWRTSPARAPGEGNSGNSR